MKIKAWAYLPPENDIRSDLMLAGAQRIYSMYELYEIARMHNTAVWTKITRTILDDTACKHHAWKLLSSHAYPRISLRILQKNIIAGLELLNEVIFEQKRISFRFHNGILSISNLGDHDSRLASKPFRRDKVLRHPLMQVLCLTHINHIPLGVIIPVYARGMWK